MCATCTEATKQPIALAMRTIAATMAARRDAGRPRLDCLDKLLGKLIGVEDTARDGEAEAAWERSRG